MNLQLPLEEEEEEKKEDYYMLIAPGRRRRRRRTPLFATRTLRSLTYGNYLYSVRRRGRGSRENFSHIFIIFLPPFSPV